ncbi:hypothetical protein GLOIN_2v1883106 [Rhizophagus irregularis DAOM 181602=DAOM 197198]|nr:hypothetical protein GLOIN_2v1883106 [Rhizophagus irregularis DAOM 181602=DAOM 197198]
MDNMSEWFINQDLAQFRENALRWRHCNSNAARNYFFLSIDLMHCLFLGIAKWIVKWIWVDENILKPETLKEIQKKMNQFQVSADIGKIPGKAPNDLG